MPTNPTHIAREHVEAAEGFLRDIVFSAYDFDLIGFHGQTVLHERPENGQLGRTVQLGDAALIARELGVAVAYDFRSADSSLDKSVYDVLGVERAINAFKSYGSTAPAEVRKQIERWMAKIAGAAQP